MLVAHVDSGGKYVYSGWLAINGERTRVDEPPAYSQAEWLYAGQHAVTALVPLEWCRAVGGFDEKIVGWEDWDFFVKLAINGYCGAHVLAPLLAYRQHTGTRREESLKNKERLLSEFRMRYVEYAGGKDMATCCGGGQAGKTIMAAKRSLAGPGGTLMSNEATISQIAEPVPSNHVRLEFTGQRQGSVTYSGQNRRTYRAGNNPSGKYHDVHKDDVDKLMSTGEFRIVERAPVVVEAPKPKAPIKSAAELQAEANAQLLKAKEDAARELELALAPTMPAEVADPAKAKAKARGKRGKRA